MSHKMVLPEGPSPVGSSWLNLVAPPVQFSMWEELNFASSLAEFNVNLLSSKWLLGWGGVMQQNGFCRRNKWDRRAYQL